MSTISAQDEILQFLYWMKGERLGEIVAREQIERFIHLDQDEIENALSALVEKNLLTRVESEGASAAWKLTDAGSREGARRFNDELSSMLGHESHLECGDLECGCHKPGFDGVCENRADA